jgi:hypothetical protein
MNGWNELGHETLEILLPTIGRLTDFFVGCLLLVVIVRDALVRDEAEGKDLYSAVTGENYLGNSAHACQSKYKQEKLAFTIFCSLNFLHTDVRLKATIPATL